MKQVGDQAIVFLAHAIAALSYVIAMTLEVVAPQAFLFSFSDLDLIWLGMSLAMFVLTGLLVWGQTVVIGNWKMITVIIAHAVLTCWTTVNYVPKIPNCC